MVIIIIKQLFKDIRHTYLKYLSILFIQLEWHCTNIKCFLKNFEFLVSFQDRLKLGYFKQCIWFFPGFCFQNNIYSIIDKLNFLYLHFSFSSFENNNSKKNPSSHLKFHVFVYRLTKLRCSIINNTSLLMQTNFRKMYHVKPLNYQFAVLNVN